MPRSTAGGASNAADTNLYLTDEGSQPSPGTSSSTSESKPEPNGSTPQATELLTPSPAPDVESPSGRVRPAKPVQSSTASSTDGSSPETGPDQPLHLDSSEASALAMPPTPVTTDDKVVAEIAQEAKDFLHLAREAFDNGDYTLADGMLDEALGLDPTLATEVMAAKAEIAEKTSNKK